MLNYAYVIVQATRLKYGAIHSADPKPMCSRRKVRSERTISTSSVPHNYGTSFFSILLYYTW